jgi:hypothetical protein
MERERKKECAKEIKQRKEKGNEEQASPSHKIKSAREETGSGSHNI